MLINSLKFCLSLASSVRKMPGPSQSKRSTKFEANILATFAVRAMTLCAYFQLCQSFTYVIRDVEPSVNYDLGKNVSLHDEIPTTIDKFSEFVGKNELVPYPTTRI